MEQLSMIENELVPVYTTSTGERVGYGTDLHRVLEIKSNYREWANRRFSDIGAVEYEDFESVEIPTLVGGTLSKLKRYKNNILGMMPEGKQLMALAVLEAQRTIEQQNRTHDAKRGFTGVMAAFRSLILVGGCQGIHLYV